MTTSPAVTLPLPLTPAETILAGLTHPVLVVDEADCLTYVNTAGEEFFRLSFGLLKGESLTHFFEPDHSIFGMIRRVRLNSASFSDQGVALASPKLGQRLLDIQVSPMLDEGRSMVGVIISLQERALAERIRGHEQFRGAARSMTSLSALLAHEIKNPLAGIRGAAELLSQNTNDANDTDLTHLIMGEADRIAALLTRMEGLAGGKTIDRAPVNIHEVIDHCINIANRSFGKDRQIITTFDPSLPDTDGDRDLLIQVLLNLIKNACEATENKGIIKIKTSFNLGARFAAGQARNVAPLVVEITDNGCGIDPELRDRIFDPFVSNKASGSGLGLSLVASTIADHGGGVEVFSDAAGSSFKISLPINLGSPLNTIEQNPEVTS